MARTANELSLSKQLFEHGLLKIGWELDLQPSLDNQAQAWLVHLWSSSSAE